MTPRSPLEHEWTDSPRWERPLDLTCLPLIEPIPGNGRGLVRKLPAHRGL